MATDGQQGAEANVSKLAISQRNRFFGPNLDLDMAQHFDARLLLSPPFSRPPPQLPAFNANTSPMDQPENPYLKFFSKVYGDYPISGPSSPSERSGWSSSASGSPTMYTDPFLRGEVPLEFNMYEENGRTKELGTVEQKFKISETTGPLPYLPKSIRQKVLFNYCVFCKNNGEDDRFFSSHTLKDTNGCITCPILHSYKCPVCGATGRIAHTVRYCPRNRDRKLDDMVPISTLKQMRSSAGGMSYNAKRDGYGHEASGRHHKARKAITRGPNSAWTGVTSQPSITPMPGDLINSQRREEKKQSRSLHHNHD